VYDLWKTTAGMALAVVAFQVRENRVFRLFNYYTDLSQPDKQIEKHDLFQLLLLHV
jgi:hypothetical protein